MRQCLYRWAPQFKRGVGSIKRATKTDKGQNTKHTKKGWKNLSLFSQAKSTVYNNLTAASDWSAVTKMTRVKLFAVATVKTSDFPGQAGQEGKIPYDEVVHHCNNLFSEFVEPPSLQFLTVLFKH